MMILHEIDLELKYNADKILELALKGELVSPDNLEKLGFEKVNVSTGRGLGTCGFQFEDGSVAVFDPTIAQSSKDWWRLYRPGRDRIY